MFDQVQIIKDHEEARFAVIPYEEYLALRELLTDREKLADYLDYLHAQQVKADNTAWFTLQEAKQLLDLE